jgi:hypothetical protein
MRCTLRVPTHACALTHGRRHFAGVQHVLFISGSSAQVSFQCSSPAPVFRPACDKCPFHRPQGIALNGQSLEPGQIPQPRRENLEVVVAQIDCVESKSLAQEVRNVDHATI